MQRLLSAMAIAALVTGSAGTALAQSSTISPASPKTPGMTQSTPPAASESGTSDMTGSRASPPATNESRMPGVSGPQAANRPSTDMIREAQQALHSKGLYHGRIDGKFGPKTRAAVRRFQARNHLRKTAQLDEHTMDRLLGGTTGSGSSLPPAGAGGPAINPSATNPSAGNPSAPIGAAPSGAGSAQPRSGGSYSH
jgi:Putative peptidoglycan binding domain